MKLYDIGKAVVKVFLLSHHRIKVIGAENIPKQGSVLICSNHVSNFDPPLIGVVSPRELSFMAKSELFDVPILGKIIANVNAFPIKRGSGDRQAIKLAMKLLKEDHTLLMFPEGSRNKTEEIGEGLSGAGFFALRTDAVVVPCAIVGSFRPFSTITVIFGEPIDMTELKSIKAKPQEATKLIMEHIRRLKKDYLSKKTDFLTS